MFGIGDLDLLCILDCLDQRHLPFRHLAEGADDLGMPRMADKQDVCAGFDQPFGAAMDLADQRAGGVEIVEPACLCCLGHHLGHAMGRKDNRAAIRHFVQFLHEYRAKAAQSVDHIAIVHDFMPNIDGRAKSLDRQFDNLDGSVDARAKTARRGNQHMEARLGKAHGRRFKASLAALLGASYERGRTTRVMRHQRNKPS